MSAVLKRITSALDMTLNCFEQVQRTSKNAIDAESITQARSAIVGANTELDTLARKYDNVRTKENSAKDGQDNFNKSIKDGGGFADKLYGKIASFVAAYAGVQGVKAIVGLSDSMTQTTARLNIMNDGLQTTEELQQKIFDSAQRSRTDYMATADVVAKLGQRAKGTFRSNDETIAFAETLNKMFVIAGASQQEISSASLQLTQALGSGVLRGEELNAVFETAPNVIQSIADYIGVPIGKIRDMAQEGQITADIVKNAMFDAAEDVDKEFENMPMTWSQVWTGMKNTAIGKLQPVLDKINSMANDPKVQSTLTNLANGFTLAANAALGLFDIVCSVGTFMQNNWSVIAPIVMGVATAFLLYNAVLMANAFWTGITAAADLIASSIKAAKTSATLASTSATAAETAAQWGLNTALLACPITWIILAVIALIAIIYAVIAHINKVKGTATSATGMILGSILGAAAFFWNIIVGVINSVIQFLWTWFVEPVIGIVEWVLNVFNGGFDSFGDAVKNLLGNIISWFLSLGKVVTKIIDAIFGTKWTEGLDTLQGEVLGWGKNDNAVTLDRNAPEGLSRWSYTDAFNKGYGTGKWVDERVKGLGDFLNFGKDENGDGTDDGKDDYIPVSDPAVEQNTGDTAKAVKEEKEDLAYLRDIAEREAVNRFTTAKVSIDMTGMSNRIDSDMDLDGVLNRFTNGFAEALEVAAEGVHA